MVSNEKKILVIGAGSIGQRHLRCLIKLKEPNLAVFKTNKGTLKNLPADIAQHVIIFNDENLAFQWQPTHVIISNPTSLHIQFLLKAIDSNANIFVEKPVVSNYELLTEPEILKINSSKTVVGYILRFSDLFLKLKIMIDTKQFGSVLKASLKVGHFLPYWHPYENYEYSYPARKELGGGALRTLSHEIDLTRFLFGEVKSLYATINKLSNLKIDTEDNVHIICSTENCNAIHLEIDFLNPILSRIGRILLENGLLEYDYFKGEIYFTSYESGNTELLFESKSSIDDQYLMQITAFLNDDDSIACPIRDGLKVDKIIYYSELSSKSGKKVCLD